MRGRRSTRRSNAMAHMGIVISKESWAVLREEPLYSARFIDREGAEELALVVRVEELDSFLEAHPPLPLALTAWRSPLMSTIQPLRRRGRSFRRATGCRIS